MENILVVFCAIALIVGMLIWGVVVYGKASANDRDNWSGM